MGRHPAHLAEPRRREARARIVAAALAQVAEGGYGSAGVQAVATRAGVATGSIYRHFTSKGELFAEVFRDAVDREIALMTAIARDGSGSPTQRLAGVVEAFARRALAAPVLSHALMAEPVDPAVEAARLASKRAYRDVFADLLDDAVATGELPPLDSPVAAAALVGALQEALIGPLAERRTGDALVASLVSFALNAVNAEEISDGHHTSTPRAAQHP
jgi:AcrR family transcriptional regulator